MISAIHQSSLNTALKCGEQFRRRYLEGERIPPGIAAGRGTGVHKANEVNLKYKVVKKIDLPLDDMKDAARDGFIHAFDDGIYLVKEDIPAKSKIINAGLNDCLRLTELYAQKVAPTINPVEVEQEFKIEVKGLSLPIAGRMDYQELPRIGDLKTTAKTWAENQIQKEIQPLFYSYAHEYMTGIRPRFIYHILIALKKECKLQEQSIVPSDRSYAALMEKLKVFCRMLETGTFMPADPTSWLCSPKWCGYYRSCKFVGN